MIRLVPLDVDYKYLNRIDSYLNKLLWFSAGLSLLVFAIDFFHLLPTYNEFLQTTLNSIISILALGYFVLDLVFNYSFQESERKRRKDFIDNSLGTTLAEENSVGYFSNDRTSVGVIKMGVNCFENSLFTKTVSSKMLTPMFIKMCAVILVFLCLALFTNNKTLTTVLQLALPLTIIQQAFKLYFFKKKIDKIFEDFNLIFSATSGNNRDNLIIDNVINYESTLAWGTVLLDSKYFNEVNPALSQKWESMKLRLNL
ncbi:hypothetical protein [Pontibacter ruber]|uniref:ABC transmembrane type-1 domain-containing protein n=1 Tax=Pontibacter ruber TaxID=1343895 RepID=A0ABW5CZW5_9BACT|nr:hypothetical protein [Pontibacter ruber]